MNQNKTIGDQLKSQREKARLSQLEVSLALGYKHNVVYRIEKGSTVKVDTLTKLNQLYGWEFSVNN